MANISVTKLLADIVVGGSDFASVSKLVAIPVVGAFPDAVSIAKETGLGLLGPLVDGISIPKMVAYAISTTKVMVLADYNWPGPGSGIDSADFLVPQNAKLSFIPYNISGGQGFTNVEQVLGVTPGRWRLDLSNIRIKTDAQRLAWEVLEFQLRGRSKTIALPIFRWRKGLVPWPVSGGHIVTSAPDYTPDVIRAFAYGEVLPGATSLTIRLDSGSDLKAGHIFSINEKVYAITSIDAVGTTGSSPVVPTFTCTIIPPIREHIDDVDQLFFDNPIIRCRLANDNSMAVDGGWNYWKSGSPSLTFWEDVTTDLAGNSPPVGDSP